MSTLDQQWANYGQQAIVFVQPAAKNSFYIWEKKTVFTFGKKSREAYFFLVTHVHYIKFKFQSPEIVPLELSHAHVLTCYGCFWVTRIRLNCCNKDCMACKPENIYYLCPHRKHLSAPLLLALLQLLLLLHNKWSSADFIIQNKNHNEYNLPTHMLKKNNITL